MCKFFRAKNTGVVLFICLVMLLLLTLLGVSSVQTTSLEQIMARNAVDANIAFQAAESALREGEDFVENLTNTQSFDASGANNNGLYDDAGPGNRPNWRNITWNSGLGHRVSSTGVTGTVRPPEYIVERVTVVIPQGDSLNLDNIGSELGTGTTQIFRVTARGQGATVDSQALVQSTYGKRL